MWVFAQVHRGRVIRTVCRAELSYGQQNDAGDNATRSSWLRPQNSCRSRLAYNIPVCAESHRRQLLGLAAAVTLGALLPRLAKAAPSGVRFSQKHAHQSPKFKCAEAFVMPHN